MADKITWVRPSGKEITTNGLPETIKLAAELGWKPKGAEVGVDGGAPAAPVEYVARRGRPPKKDE